MLAVCQSTDIVIYDFPKIIFLKKYTSDWRNTPQM